MSCCRFQGSQGLEYYGSRDQTVNYDFDSRRLSFLTACRKEILAFLTACWKETRMSLTAY